MKARIALAASLIAGLSLTAVTGCATSATTGEVNDVLSADTALTFEVGGSATEASITYMTDGFATQQETAAALPWKKTVTFTKGTTGVNMNAQNAGGGSITCKITDQSGKVLSENTSSGDYAIVSCAV